MKILSIFTGIILLGSSVFSNADDAMAVENAFLINAEPASIKQRVQITDAQLLQLSSAFAAEMPPLPEELFPYMLFYAIESSYPGILDPARLGIQVEPQTAIDTNDTQSFNLTMQALSETDPGPPVPPGAGGGGGSTNTNSSSNLSGLKLAIDRATNGYNQLRILDYTNPVPYDIFWTAEIGSNAVWSLWRQNELNRTILFPQSMTGNGFFLLATIYDTDQDGLTDAYEALVSKTKPGVKDSDGDGFEDGVEIRLGMDPLNANDGPQYWTNDSDGDGVTDGDEIQLGMDPFNSNDKFQIWVSQPGVSQLP